MSRLDSCAGRISILIRPSQTLKTSEMYDKCINIHWIYDNASLFVGISHCLARVDCWRMQVRVIRKKGGWFRCLSDLLAILNNLYLDDGRLRTSHKCPAKIRNSSEGIGTRTHATTAIGQTSLRRVASEPSRFGQLNLENATKLNTCMMQRKSINIEVQRIYIPHAYEYVLNTLAPAVGIKGSYLPRTPAWTPGTCTRCCPLMSTRPCFCSPQSSLLSRTLIEDVRCDLNIETGSLTFSERLSQRYQTRCLV